MTLGAWLSEDHLNDIEPIVRHFNFERPASKRDPKKFPAEKSRCKILSVEIHLVYFTVEQSNRSHGVPNDYRGSNFGLYLRPKERKWHAPKMMSTGDSAQTFFTDFTEMMEFACDIRKSLNRAGVKTSWSIDFHNQEHWSKFTFVRDKGEIT